MTVTGMNGIKYSLDFTPIGSGGEGDIYAVCGMDYVAKIYKKGTLSADIEEKLKIMIENPPNASVLSQVAWPLDLAYNENGECCGFIMPKISINAELGEIYKYPTTLPISSHQKLNIAQNICVVISEVHRAGYVFGDFNPRNIGLDKNTGLVSFLDTDTYHVIDPTKGKTYRCAVCAPGYAAPELLDKCSDYIATNPAASKNAYAQTPLPTFTQETDNFALAIHIFKLLMNGYTPFGGIIETASVSQSSPGVGDAAVRRNNYCYRPGYKPQSVAIPRLDAFPKEIMDLFTRAFIEGKATPTKRPSAVEWHEALARYESVLVTCSENSLHQYDYVNTDCPFCEADRKFGEAMSGKLATSKLKQGTYSPPPLMVQKQITHTASSGNVKGYSPAPTPVHASNPTTSPYKKILAIGVPVVAVIIIAIIYFVHLSNVYNEAQWLLARGQYVEARETFSRISTHRDSAARIQELNQIIDYENAISLINVGQPRQAYEVFRALGNFRESHAFMEDARNLMYPIAVTHYRNENFVASAAYFEHTAGIGYTDNFVTLIRARAQLGGHWNWNWSGYGWNCCCEFSSFLQFDWNWTGIELLDLLEFEDAREIIRDNTSLLQNFLGMRTAWDLAGNWHGYMAHSITFTQRAEGGPTGHYGLPRPTWNHDFFNVTDGSFVWLCSNGTTLLGDFTIVSLNQISVFNHYDGITYTLYRFSDWDEAQRYLGEYWYAHWEAYWYYYDEEW